MRKTLSILIAVTLVLSFSVVATTPVAAGATLEVGPGKTYATIQAAVNAATPGDMILVYPGVYGEHQFTTTPPHWSASDQYAPALIVWKDNLTIQAVDPSPGTTVMESTYDLWSNPVAIQASTGGSWDGSQYVGAGVNPASGTAPNAVAIIASGVTLDGFTIRRPVPTDGSKGSGYNACSVMIGGLYAGYGGAGETLCYNNNTIKNCTFRETWKGVYIWRSSGNTIEENTIEALGNTGHWAGISIYDGGTVVAPPTSQNNVIRGNVIADKGIAVGAWPGQTDNSGTIIEGNTCTQIGITYSSSANVEIRGNMMGRIWTEGYSATIRLTSLTVVDNTVGGADPNGMPFSWVNGGTFSRNSISNSKWNGIVLRNSSDVLLTGNTITDNGRNGIALVDSSDALVTGNTITDSAASGIVLMRTSNVDVEKNTILRNAGGFSNPGGLTIQEGVTGTSATCNVIADNNIGVWVKDDAGTDNEAHFNEIQGNTVFGVQNNHSTAFDARHNWWGDDSGPGGVGPGSGDAVTSSVLYDPWIRKTVAASTGTGNAGFALSHGNILNLTPVAAPGLPSVTFPHGMFSFQICCLDPGESVVVTVTLPAAVPVGTVWWKYDNGRWYSLPNLSDNGDNIMKIRLTDGGTGDSDSVPGQITDPGGPGNPMTVGWEGSPANKAAVLWPWIALVVAIAAGLSLLVLRRRRSEG